jgi:hypothetical protein
VEISPVIADDVCSDSPRVAVETRPISRRLLWLSDERCSTVRIAVALLPGGTATSSERPAP